MISCCKIINDSHTFQRPSKKLPAMAELEEDVIKFDLEVKEYFKGKMTKPQEIERKTKEIIVKEKRVRFANLSLT